MRRFLLRSPDADGGGASDDKGTDAAKGQEAKADKVDAKPDATAAELATLRTKLAEMTAAEEARAAKIAADAKAADEAARLARGEHEKMLAERDAELTKLRTAHEALSTREAQRIALAEADAAKLIAELPEELRDVPMAIPDVDARLAAVRKMVAVAKGAEARPAGPGPRATKAPEVVIPDEIVEEARTLNVSPAALYAAKVKTGRIKPAARAEA